MRIYFMDAKSISKARELWTACLQIKESELVVVANDTDLTHDSALAIFFGMILKRPIIIHNIPQFSQNTYPFLRDAISKRLNKLVIANIGLLEHSDTQNILSTTGAASVNYTLTRHETIIGRSYLLSRLRGVVT